MVSTSIFAGTRIYILPGDEQYSLDSARYPMSLRSMLNRTSYMEYICKIYKWYFIVMTIKIICWTQSEFQFLHAGNSMVTTQYKDCPSQLTPLITSINNNDNLRFGKSLSWTGVANNECFKKRWHGLTLTRWLYSLSGRPWEFRKWKIRKEINDKSGRTRTFDLPIMRPIGWVLYPIEAAQCRRYMGMSTPVSLPLVCS